MRNKLKLVHESNMFGTRVLLQEEDQTHVLAENLERSWSKLNKRVKGGYWFRAPTINLDRLSVTARFLSQLENPFQFEVHSNEGKWDASLRVSNEDDAEFAAWSLNGLYDKWSAVQEKEFKSQLKAKPLKATVGKDGKVRIKGKVNVLNLPPDPV